MKINENIEITNEDNMLLMARYPDNYFDLAIVDPPYGINADKPTSDDAKYKVKQKNGTTLLAKKTTYKHKNWDNKPADASYFDELKRVSKNQIIWGVNYYDYNFTGGRIVWDKMNGDSDQFGCEIAYNSLNNRTDIIRFMWAGMFQGVNITTDITKANFQQGNKKLNEKRIHPTQKPVKLYEWTLKKYAKKGDVILDTHGGSLNIAIAIDNLNKIDKMNLTLVACEIDKDYFKTSTENVISKTNWQSLFNTKH